MRLKSQNFKLTKSIFNIENHEISLSILCFEYGQDHYKWIQPLIAVIYCVYMRKNLRIITVGFNNYYAHLTVLVLMEQR